MRGGGKGLRFYGVSEAVKAAPLPFGRMMPPPAQQASSAALRSRPRRKSWRLQAVDPPGPAADVPTPYRKGGLASWRLKRALELLEGDLGAPPTLAELARHLGLRPTSFCRAFKQSTGLSPHQYLLSHRINCAKQMMRDQERSLTAIALDCGFSSSSQFSVAFRRMVGTSPREFRRSL